MASTRRFTMREKNVRDAIFSAFVVIFRKISYICSQPMSALNGKNTISIRRQSLDVAWQHSRQTRKIILKRKTFISESQ